MLLLGITLDGFSGNIQERTEYPAIPNRHTRPACQSPASEHFLDNGFNLIVAMMGHRNTVRLFFLNFLFKDFIPIAAGPLLKILFGELFRIYAVSAELDLQFTRRTSDQPCIFIGGIAPLL